MLLTKAFISVLAGSALTWGNPIETEPLIKERKADVGCPGGGYLVFSANNAVGSYTFCIGTTTAIALGWIAGISSASAAVYLRNAWRNGTCGVPVTATVQAGGDSKRSLPTPTVDQRTPTLEKRDPAVTAYGFSVESGFDSHACNFSLTDDQWAQGAHAISEYMIDYEDECVQVIVAGDDGYEANTLTWIMTDDGTNHKTCG